jgi:class 3 adenylate cyclase
MTAAAHPDRIDALALVGSWARIVEAPDYPIGAAPEIIERLRELIVGRWGEPVALSGFVGRERAQDERLREFWGRLLRSGSSPAGVNRVIDTWHELDVRALLPSVRQRSLVVTRSEDHLAPRCYGEYLAEHIPEARLVEVPGPHWIAIEGDAITEEIEEFFTGERHRPATDRALATVLFTDIVGSTSLAAEVGDTRWRALLADHDEVVRRELSRAGGREVKHLGDGFMAAFDGPARAIRCAQAISEGVRGLEIRVGIHTGECEVRGDDLAGMAVHIGARVAASAGPSEVLVSGTVRDLVVGSGLQLDDRGVHELRGVEGEWRLFALRR